MKTEMGIVSEVKKPSNRKPGLHRPTQLDFALPVTSTVVRRVSIRSSGRPCPRKKADWWFSQMRQLVAEGRELDAPGVF
ncbi:MAG TPA: hypothetical protein PLX89_08170 [Verrucomicrobiota bacterium]|nr:hypothetical protein [Verrucomicrobiota bacterium]